MPLARREELARRLADAADDAKERLLDHLARYQLGLSLVGLSDAYLVAPYRVRRLAGVMVTAIIKLAIVAPFAAVALFPTTWLIVAWVVPWDTCSWST